MIKKYYAAASLFTKQYGFIGKVITPLLFVVLLWWGITEVQERGKIEKPIKQD